MGARTKQNVLFVICDQLRADHLGFAGNSIVRTPNIDRIAEGGTVFDRAYVSNPVCMPNRSTIMTGLMPSAHGVVFNDRSLAPNHNTFVRQLREAGWRTGLIGKSHLQYGETRDTVVDFRLPPGRFSAFAEGWDALENQERFETDELSDPDDFYGFDHFEITLGHGAMVGGHHYRWARARGIDHELLTCGLDPTADIPGRSEDWWQIHPAPFPEDSYSTAFVTDRTIAFVEEAESNGDPWMAWCSFPDPHHPLSPPEPWFSRHQPDDVELPSNFHDPGNDWPPHITALRSFEASQSGPGFVIPFGPTEAQARAAIATTYGMIEAIDHGVGRIVARLEELGAADDTIIVFTSDHGDMMGDHGLILKGAMHFQGCLRVPMVVNAPGTDGQRSTSLVSSIDLPHTVLELCEVDEYQGMQGHSLTPLLTDSAATVRNHVLVEDDFPASEVTPFLPLRTRTVLTDRYRFTRDSNGFESLYDLSNDPDELTNLAAVGAEPQLRAELLTALTDAMLDADDMTRTATDPMEKVS